MSKLWWSLPGPSRYVAGVAQAVRDGNHVVLPLPNHLPPGLDTAIQKTLGPDWPWHEVSPNPEPSPLDYLFGRFVPDTPPELLRSPQALVQQSRFRNRILWLRLRTPRHWVCWRAFIEAYRAACHGYARGDHAQFIIALEGTTATLAPAPETLLVVHSWRGVVSSLDAMLYAALLLRDRPLDHLPRRVAVATIAALSLWDAQVAERLAVDSDYALEDPTPVLSEIGRARGWEGSSTPSWEAGQIDTLDGEALVHSALYALQLNYAGIEGRRWKAQISVVFPFLEERRRDLIETLGDRLHAPHTFSRNGHQRYVETVEEFEFADILEQLREPPVADRNTQSLVRRLRDMRNKLAHLETVAAEDLSFPFMAQVHRLGL